MDKERLIDDALHEPVQAISYRLHRWLRGLFPDKALLEGNDQTFNLEGYGRAGHCTLEENALPLSQHLTYWLLARLRRRPLPRAADLVRGGLAGRAPRRAGDALERQHVIALPLLHPGR